MGEAPKIPDWLAQYRQPGHEIKRIKGNYYLYERTSEWDPKTKRTKKVSGAYRGKLTPEGIVPPKHARPSARKLSQIRLRSLDYGVMRLAIEAGGVCDTGGAVFDSLLARGCSVEAARVVCVMAILMLSDPRQINLSEAYERSYLSVMYPSVDITAACSTEEHRTLIEKTAQEFKMSIEKLLDNTAAFPEKNVDKALYALGSIHKVFFAGTWHSAASTAHAARLCQALGWSFEN